MLRGVLRPENWPSRCVRILPVGRSDETQPAHDREEQVNQKRIWRLWRWHQLQVQRVRRRSSPRKPSGRLITAYPGHSAAQRLSHRVQHGSTAQQPWACPADVQDGLARGPSQDPGDEHSRLTSSWVSCHPAPRCVGTELQQDANRRIHVDMPCMP